MLDGFFLCLGDTALGARRAFPCLGDTALGARRAFPCLLKTPSGLIFGVVNDKSCL